MSQLPTLLGPWTETLEFLRARAVVPKDQFLTLPDELRMRAFTIARQTDARILQETLNALRETVAQGRTLWDFRENFPALAKPYTEAGRNWHLALVFRNNQRQAHAVGAYQARQQVKAAFPYVEYRTGPNPRPGHAALDGKIFEVDDPFLLAHTPPWEHGCNCDLVSRTAAQVGRVRQEDRARPLESQRVVAGNPVLQEQVARNKLPGPGGHPADLRPPTQKPDGDSYSFRPDRLNQPVDLRPLGPELRDRLMQDLGRFGYQLAADGQSAVPASPAVPMKSWPAAPTPRQNESAAAPRPADRPVRVSGRVGAARRQIASNRVGPVRGHRRAA